MLRQPQDSHKRNRKNKANTGNSGVRALTPTLQPTGYVGVVIVNTVAMEQLPEKVTLEHRPGGGARWRNVPEKENRDKTLRQECAWRVRQAVRRPVREVEGVLGPC